MPLVSVIIPTYNRQQLVQRAIRSVLSQTFSDFEILVVDDGSTDNTAVVIQAFEDPRIVYLNQNHSGLPAVARNTGIKHATGDYIAFLDSDDLWLPEKLDLQIAFMTAHSEIGLSFTNIWIFESDPEECWPEPALQPGNTYYGREFNRLYGHYVIYNLTVMIRSEVPDAVGGLNEDPKLKSVEDYEYWLRISHHFPIGYIDKPLAKYNRHAGGISKAGASPHHNQLILANSIDSTFPEVKTVLKRQRRRWLSYIHHNLGIALYREGRIGEANHHLLEALKLHPADVIVRSLSYPRKWYQRQAFRV